MLYKCHPSFILLPKKILAYKQILQMQKLQPHFDSEFHENWYAKCEKWYDFHSIFRSICLFVCLFIQAYHHSFVSFICCMYIKNVLFSFLRTHLLHVSSIAYRAYIYCWQSHSMFNYCHNYANQINTHNEKKHLKCWRDTYLHMAYQNRESPTTNTHKKKFHWQNTWERSRGTKEIWYRQ